jgi:hypothetical protein
MDNYIIIFVKNLVLHIINIKKYSVLLNMYYTENLQHIR